MTTTTTPHGSDLLIEIAFVLTVLVLTEDGEEARLRVSSALQSLTGCNLIEGQLATEVAFSREVS